MKFILGLVAFVFFWGEWAMAVEEPKFELVETLGEIEIRKYGPMVVAETEVTGDFNQVGNQGFRRIAEYIFGGNQQKEKIAMTAPVLQESSGKAARIAFVMPADKSLSHLPVPSNAQVSLKEIPARKMAVLKYSGTWSEERYLEKLQELLNHLKARKLATKGTPLWARYNPPWMPWFLRRNEVLIEVE